MPLAICAVLAAGLTLYRLRPGSRPVSFEPLLGDVVALMEGGALTDAADAAANLLEMDPPLPTAQQAALHDLLAEIIYRRQRARSLPSPENARRLLEHQEAALRLGLALDTGRLLRAARAREWLGDRKRAGRAYRRVLAQQPAPEQRRLALQGLVRLLAGQPQLAARRQRLLRQLLADEGLSDAYLWWALQQAIQHALDAERPEQARDLLLAHGGRLRRSDLKGYYHYLRAWILVGQGRHEEAEPVLDWIDGWLTRHAELNNELDRAGYLPAMCRYLRGCLDLGEQRPQAALAHFAAAQRMQPHGDLLVLAAIGRGQALARLERHAAALRVFSETIDALRAAAARQGGLRRLRNALLALSETRAARADYENAIGYFDTAIDLLPGEPPALRLGLLERLGRLHELAAGPAREAQTTRRHHALAGRCFEQAAQLAVMDEARYAALLWSSAEQYDQAGQLADARRLLLKFVEAREVDPQLPQALLKLGQSFEAEGRLEQALDWYRATMQRFPKLEEAARARLLSASCLIALGPERWPQAEELLRALLEDERIAPDAAVFRDGLLLLCDLLYRQQRYSEVITRLDDFLALYPQDRGRLPSQFLLADAYRQSAYRLRDRPPRTRPRARALAESRARFRRAAALFGQFLDGVRGVEQSDRRLPTYRQLALFYRGDCLFELNEPATLREALAVYGEIAARYETEPASLTAQVQIANIYLRQGKLREAARAVERARWLLRNIRPAAFAGRADGSDRAYWDRYLSAIFGARLFQDAFEPP